MRVRIIVRGRGQGVGFRYSTVREARRLGLSGWVRNTEDGQVELVADGTHVEIRQLTDWCRSGPPGARVATVRCSEEPGNSPLGAFELRW